MKKLYKKGFTLLEVLVVAAIIAVLMGVVIAMLTSARSKGGDAGVKSNLKSAIPQGEIFFGTNTAASNSYTNVCTNGVVGGAQGVGLMVLTAAKNAGLSSYAINGTGSGTTATCNANANAWAAEVPLSGSTNASPNMWCVDSVGKAKVETVSIGAGASCN